MSDKPTPNPSPKSGRGTGSRRSYSARNKGASIGTMIHVLVYLLVVHPLRWVLAKLRGKPAPGIPRYIEKLMND